MATIKMRRTGFIDLKKKKIHKENFCWFTVGSVVCKDSHNTYPLVRSCSQITEILSDFTFWQHDCITVQKNQSFFSVCADFPMPSANHHPHEIHFSALMSEGLFAGPLSYFIFLIFFSPSTVCFISIHRAYPHSQTYFRSKLTQPLEAPYPNMGSGISLCFFCPPVCITRMIS